MLLTWSVLVQICSMRAQINGIGDRFSVYILISMNLFQIFHSQQNYTFRGAKSESNMSSFEGATWPTFHWPNGFIFGSYP